MEDKNKNIDQLFKDHLSKDRHYEIPESYLNDLDKRINERRKKRRNGFIFFFLILFAGLASGAVWLFKSELYESDQITQSEKNDIVVDSSINKTQSNEKNETLEQSQNNDQVKQDKKLYPIEKESDQSETKQTDNNTVSNSTPTNFSSPTQTVSKKNDEDLSKVDNSSSLKASTTPSNKEQTSTNSSKSDQSTTEQKKSNSTKTDDDKTEVITDKPAEKNVNETEDLSKEKDAQPMHQPNETDNQSTEKYETIEDRGDTSKESTNGDSTSIADTEVIDSTKKQQPQDIEAASEIDSTLTENTEVDSSSEDLQNPEIEINDDEPTPRKFWIDAQLYGGVDFVNAKLMGTTQEETDIFNNNNKTQIAAHYGIGANFNLKQAFVGLGLSMYNIKDKVNYQEYDVMTNTYDTIVPITVDSILYDTTGTFPIDTIQVQSYDTTTYNVNDSTMVDYGQQNTYQLFAIPFSVGYTFTHKNWAFRPALNAVFEFRRKQFTGTYPVYSGNTVLEQLQAIKFGMSLGLSVQVQYNLRDWYVFTKPGYRYRLMNVAENGNYYVKHHAFQAHFGVGYTF